MKIFNSIGHFFAWLLSKAIPAASSEVQAVATAVSSPLGQAIATLLGAKGATIQAGIEAIAGDVLNAFGAAGAAIAAGGLNVSFDTATIAAIEAIYADLQTMFGKTTTTTTTAPPASAS